MSDIGEKVRERREKSGLSQTQLAQNVGSTQAWISRIERGMAEPSDALIEKIGKALKTPVEKLTGKKQTSTRTAGTLDAYRRKLIVRAVETRINEEIKRLAAGMNVSEEAVRSVWEKQLTIDKGKLAKEEEA